MTVRRRTESHGNGAYPIGYTPTLSMTYSAAAAAAAVAAYGAI